VVLIGHPPSNAEVANMLKIYFRLPSVSTETERGVNFNFIDSIISTSVGVSVKEVMGQDPYIHQQIYIYFFIIRTYINELQLSAWFLNTS